MTALAIRKLSGDLHAEALSVFAYLYVLFGEY